MIVIYCPLSQAWACSAPYAFSVAGEGVCTDRLPTIEYCIAQKARADALEEQSAWLWLVKAMVLQWSRMGRFHPKRSERNAMTPARPEKRTRSIAGRFNASIVCQRNVLTTLTYVLRNSKQEACISKVIVYCNANRTAPSDLRRTCVGPASDVSRRYYRTNTLHRTRVAARRRVPISLIFRCSARRDSWLART
jgi:hypothetical protein